MRIVLSLVFDMDVGGSGDVGGEDDGEVVEGPGATARVAGRPTRTRPATRFVATRRASGGRRSGEGRPKRSVPWTYRPRPARVWSLLQRLPTQLATAGETTRPLANR